MLSAIPCIQSQHVSVGLRSGGLDFEFYNDLLFICLGFFNVDMQILSIRF